MSSSLLHRTFTQNFSHKSSKSESTQGLSPARSYLRKVCVIILFKHIVNLFPQRKIDQKNYILQ